MEGEVRLLPQTQEKRGSEDDFKELGGELRALQRSYPDFKEAAKAGMQDKLKDLVRELEAKGIKINWTARHGRAERGAVPMPFLSRCSA